MRHETVTAYPARRLPLRFISGFSFLAKHLIVNADDFGLSAGVNSGIMRAHERGIVTSASLMVRQPYAREAAIYAREHAELSVGLHLDLGEWSYIDGEWVRLYSVVPEEDPAAVSSEVAHQLALFGELVGKPPNHLDSHQHIHRSEPVRSVMVEAARRLGVPLRDCTPNVRYCGDFYGMTAEGQPFPELISASGLINIVRKLPLGTTELGCHPGSGEKLDTMYWRERAQETEVLCDPAVMQAIIDAGITLRSFG